MTKPFLFVPLFMTIVEETKINKKFLNFKQFFVFINTHVYVYNLFVLLAKRGFVKVCM